MDTLFKLSPSDFKYLWNDCKYCYYRKVVHGIEQPSIQLPGIFNRMSGAIQRKVQGTNPADFHPDLPSGTFELQERYLRSAAVPSIKASFISGRFDLLSKFEDGTHGVIDLKITEPKEEDLHKFTHQLHAYKYALENPVDESKRMANKISKMGLLVVAPQEVSFHKGHIFFRSQPTFYEVKEDMDGFFSFIDEVSEFLKGDLPKESETCKWCQYRRLTNDLTRSLEAKDADLPF